MKPGLRHEIGVCILAGDIVWVTGPFPCSDWSDIDMFWFAVKHMLEAGERVEADDGCIGEDLLKAKVPKSVVCAQDDAVHCMQAKARLWHETVNKRMKKFECLATIFCHCVTVHGVCF